MRKQARECCYQLLFEYLFLGETKEDTHFTIKEEMGLSAEDDEFVVGILDGVKKHFEKLKKVIADYAKDFTIDRLYKTDLAALLFGVYEVLYCPETPAAVAINEAVELAKKYSEEKSSGFVNGILAAIESKKEQIRGEIN